MCHDPSTVPAEEDRRRICRERKVLIAERVAHVNRIKGLLFSQGVADYEPFVGIGGNGSKKFEQVTGASCRLI